MLSFCSILEPIYDYIPDDMEYETPVVNNDVPMTTETNYVKTKLNELSK